MTSASVPKIDSHFDPDGLIDRACGAYLGLAVGDALGATVEFMTPREIRHVHGVHTEIIGGGWLKLKPGRVTDDTEMSLALGAAILLEGGFGARSIAEQFDLWLKSKPVDVGNTVRRGIVRFRTHGTVSGPENECDAGNGAVMRTLPVVLATLGAPPEEVCRAARIQAHITHNTALADHGLGTVVAMVRRALINHGRAYPDMVTLAHELGEVSSEYVFTYKRQENPSGYLPDSLRAVFQAFVRTDGFEAALIDVVNRGGDADTTGAVLGMIAGAHYGAKDIPKRWLDALDPDMRALCEAQAQALLEMSPLLSGRPIRFISD